MSSQGIRSSHPCRNGGEAQAYDIAQLLFGQALRENLSDKIAYTFTLKPKDENKLCHSTVWITLFRSFQYRNAVDMLQALKIIPLNGIHRGAAACSQDHRFDAGKSDLLFHSPPFEKG